MAQTWFVWRKDDEGENVIGEFERERDAIKFLLALALVVMEEDPSAAFEVSTHEIETTWTHVWIEEPDECDETCKECNSKAS